MFQCLCVSMLLKSLVEINIKIKNHSHCINIYNDNWRTTEYYFSFSCLNLEFIYQLLEFGSAAWLYEQYFQISELFCSGSRGQALISMLCADQRIFF